MSEKMNARVCIVVFYY